MSQVATLENAELAYDARDHESPVARLAGRLKSACCRQCGSVDGMQSVHREVLIHLKVITVVSKLAPWYLEPGNAEYLFCLCPRCNLARRVPDGYEEILFTDMLDWLSNYDGPNLMAPDYDALAREEPGSQIGDSRDAAGRGSTYGSADRPEFYTNEGSY